MARRPRPIADGSKPPALYHSPMPRLRIRFGVDGVAYLDPEYVDLMAINATLWRMPKHRPAA